VSRFVERIEKCDRIIVLGTPLYRKKYDNKDTSTGYVVAAEVDLISNRPPGHRRPERDGPARVTSRQKANVTATIAV
jgi:hypothetical protein